MKKTCFSIAVLAISFIACAQKPTPVINADEVERIETFLASDELRGRKTGSPEIDKAADFIAAEFAKIGLSTLDGLEDYRQSFVVIRPKQLSLTVQANGNSIDEKKVVVITAKPDFIFTDYNGYEKVKIQKGENVYEKASAFLSQKGNKVVLVDTSFSKNMGVFGFLKRSFFNTGYDHVFILENDFPASLNINAQHEIKEEVMTNVVGVIPGKSKKEEYVLFSGHYDHIGIGKPQDGDSIYNGANDNASGTTATILLADFYKKLNNNERTLIFVAFTAEEIGGFGSRYFSQQLDPATVMAMCNIEMIGTETKWGKNSAFITGYEKTDMGEILQKNLQGSGFTFYPDPYTEQQLFYRSDNATLARLGVPAHTISTAKMENEPHYHKATDHVETLDLKNMAKIIESIAVSMQTIISGQDTPTRVRTEELR